MMIIISSPSGCGKSTLAKHLLSTFDTIKLSVSTTTRKKRDGEIDGQHYHFKTKEEYDLMVKNDEFIESVEFCGNCYGSPKSECRSIQQGGFDVLFEIETEGAKNIKKHSEFDIVSIFILPPKFETLKSRLERRQSNTQDEIQDRVNKAREELLFATYYDYILINDDLEEAKRKIEAIYIAERLKRKRADKIELSHKMSKD